MTELAAEWVEKAEGDYATAGREWRARRQPNYDAACFHAQQTAEKYLKAFLQEHGVAFPKIHSLIELLELCLPLDASFELQRDHLVRLDRYAVRYRYPGESADKVANCLPNEWTKNLCAKRGDSSQGRSAAGIPDGQSRPRICAGEVGDPWCLIRNLQSAIRSAAEIKKAACAKSTDGFSLWV